MAHLHSTQVFDVSGATVLVTGGGTGLGLMMAKGLAENGAKVYIGGRRREVVEGAAVAHGDGKITPISLDVTNKKSIEAAVKLISSENEGKLDILINNAGKIGPISSFFSYPNSPERKDTQILGTAMFTNESFEDWANTFSTNVSSIYFVSMAFLGLLETASKARDAETGGWGSSIINITSISGQIKQSQNHFAYNTSKAAGIHLTKMLSTELALRKIPGSEWIIEDLDAALRGFTRIPARRGGIDKDIVGAALYLSSPASYYVNGQILTVDGGFTGVNPAVY
ncbi:Splicing factor [Ceratobasidium sp. 423]|nr:Splicing factor [Ceratobasidium sp. 423]